MQISKYLQQKRCPEMGWFGESIQKDSRWSVYGKEVKTACDELAAGTDYKTVLLGLYARLNEGYAAIYKEYGWQAEGYARDDVRKMRRFLVFLGNDAKILEANVPTTFVGEEGLVLEGRAALVFEKEGRTYLAVIRPGKCDRSPGGKSLATKVSGDLRLLVAKWSLEDRYPGIIPWSVYMTKPADADGAIDGDFSFVSTKETNLTVLPVSAYYKDGVLSRELLKDAIVAAAQIPEEKRCDDCDYACLCKAGARGEASVTLVPEEETLPKESDSYKLPTFTDEQLEVINHDKGPLLVCAGAGSGKTAALVGRIARLVEKGVSPNTILCLTFANEAANELKKRCRALFDDGGKPPKISTFHGLAMELLCGYGAEVGVIPAALDDMTQQRIVDNLLAETERIPGFKYEVKTGRYGLLNTVINRIEELRTLGETAFREKHPDVGEGFYGLAQKYRDKLKEEHLLAYDEMVPAAIRLLREHDEILGVNQMSYRFIMVDEFQDISADQAELLYMLAESHRNIVAVGDDDQCIYRWRGACPSYMLDFPKKFGARTIVFTHNFRSTDGIVELGQSVIRHNDERIEKNVVSSSGKTGAQPRIIRSTNAADVRRIISEAVADGYHYGDVAIIGRTNKTINELKERLGLPCRLARRFLRHDAFFGLVRGVLNLAEDPTDAMSFALFCAPFGLQYDAVQFAKTVSPVDTARSFDKFAEAIKVLDDLMTFAKNGLSPKEFIEKCALRTFWSASNAPTVMKDEFLMAHPKGGTLADLKAWCRDVEEYASEKRVTERATNAVTLITNHDCKGLEFPVVLLICEYTQTSPEERSLFFVGITRAEERLYLFESPNPKASFLSETEGLLTGTEQ